MFLQTVIVSEKVETFKWHSIAVQFRPIAHIFVVYILNDLNICQLYEKLLGGIDPL